MSGPQFVMQIVIDTPAFAENRNEELRKIVEIVACDIQIGRLKPNVTRAVHDGNGTVVGFATIVE